MNTSISQQRQDLQAQIAEASQKIAGLEGELRTLDTELASHLGQRAQYQSLDEMCASLEKLGKSGAAGLFREAIGADPEKQLQQLRGVVATFQQKTSSFEKLRGVLQADIQNQQKALRLLRDQLAGLQESVQPLKTAYQPSVPSADISYRVTVLPWTSQSDDERRFRYLLIPILFFAILFGGVVPFMRPPVEENMGMVVPERIARIIKKKQEARLEAQKPAEKLAEKTEEKTEEKKEKPAEKLAEKKPEKIPGKPAEKIAESTPSNNVPPPVVPEAQAPPKAPEGQGILAFKNDLANILNEATPAKMGADARISINANRATNKALQRSIIVSQVSGGSGGINTAALSRQSEAGEVKRITDTDIKVAHVESPTAAVAANNEQPLSKGGKASRTDEEIQIVFDQYKSALYRIYNRELRNNPSLRGKMVLRIVIEPDGHVSDCTVKSTDLASPALSADIVNRVLKFDFGAKEGAPAITILYPIAFLPSS